nr:MAG TPA_asm: hypothetical protein [Bacteriophage sp.]
MGQSVESFIVIIAEGLWIEKKILDVKIKRNTNRHLLKLQEWQMQRDCPMASIV